MAPKSNAQLKKELAEAKVKIAELEKDKEVLSVNSEKTEVVKHSGTSDFKPINNNNSFVALSLGVHGTLVVVDGAPVWLPGVRVHIDDSQAPKKPMRYYLTGMK